MSWFNSGARNLIKSARTTLGETNPKKPGNRVFICRVSCKTQRVVVKTRVNWRARNLFQSVKTTVGERNPKKPGIRVFICRVSCKTQRVVVKTGVNLGPVT